MNKTIIALTIASAMTIPAYASSSLPSEASLNEEVKTLSPKEKRIAEKNANKEARRKADSERKEKIRLAKSEQHIAASLEKQEERKKLGIETSDIEAIANNKKSIEDLSAKANTAYYDNMAQNDHISANKKEIDGLSAKANAVYYDNEIQNDHISANKDDIEATRKVADEGLTVAKQGKKLAESNQSQLTDVSKVVQSNTDEIGKTRKVADEGLAVAKQGKKLAESNKSQLTEVSTTVTANTNNISLNSKAIDVQSARMTKAEEELYATTARSKSNTKRIGALEADMRNVKEDVKDLERGMAGVAAMSMLAQPYGVGNFNVSASVGGYKSESAIAVGMGYRATEQVTFRAGAAANTGNDVNVTWGASVGYEF